MHQHYGVSINPEWELWKYDPAYCDAEIPSSKINIYLGQMSIFVVVECISYSRRRTIYRMLPSIDEPSCTMPC